MNTTKAWVIHPADGDPRTAGPTELELEDIPLGAPGDGEVLVEPLYGSWEHNMTHALARRPVDVCRARGEDTVVLGNSGVGRVLAGGPGTTLREGALCLFALPHRFDSFGYPTHLMGFDLPGRHGILARRGIWKETDLVPLPAPTRHSLPQWAAFGVRYLTAWSSWKVAYGAWRLQMSEDDQDVPFVWAWGGGTSLATVQLARYFRARTAIISGMAERLELAATLGITPIDRRPFKELARDEDRLARDPDYARRYAAAEDAFLQIVRAHTDNLGASIFIDYIGTPVIHATVRALARQGVIATAGWLEGKDVKLVRAFECIKRHTHVHTHGYRRSEVVPAMQFGEQRGWMPVLGDRVQIYAFDDIPRLASDFADGKIASYFPIYQINPV